MNSSNAADRIAYYATLIKDTRYNISRKSIKTNVSKEIQDIQDFERKIMELEQLKF